MSSITFERVRLSRFLKDTVLTICLEYPNIQLTDHYPVINVGNRENPVYLPAEVCVVEPGQTIKRRLSPEQTQKLISFACRKPWENANSIISDGRAALGLNPAASSILVSSTDGLDFLRNLILHRQDTVSQSLRT